MFFLVIIEIPVDKVVVCGGDACRVAVGDEVMHLANEIEKIFVLTPSIEATAPMTRHPAMIAALMPRDATNG